MNVLAAMVLNPVTTKLKIHLSTHLKTYLQELVKDTSFLKTPVRRISLKGQLAHLLRIRKPKIPGT